MVGAADHELSGGTTAPTSLKKVLICVSASVTFVKLGVFVKVDALVDLNPGAIRTPFVSRVVYSVLEGANVIVISTV